MARRMHAKQAFARCCVTVHMCTLSADYIPSPGINMSSGKCAIVMLRTMALRCTHCAVSMFVQQVQQILPLKPAHCCRNLARLASGGSHSTPLADFGDGTRVLGRRASDILALNAALAALPNAAPQCVLQRPRRVPRRLWTKLSPEQRQMLCTAGVTAW